MRSSIGVRLARATDVPRLTSLVAELGHPATAEEIAARLDALQAAGGTVLVATRGCGLVEVTSNQKRTEAHAFYHRLGYEVTSVRLYKSLVPPA